MLFSIAANKQEQDSWHETLLVHLYIILKYFFRKILNELSSPVSVTKIDEESNSSQSQDGESQDSSGAIQYSTATGNLSQSYR